VSAACGLGEEAKVTLEKQSVGMEIVDLSGGQNDQLNEAEAPSFSPKACMIAGRVMMSDRLTATFSGQ